MNFQADYTQRWHEYVHLASILYASGLWFSGAEDPLLAPLSSRELIAVLCLSYLEE